MSDIPYDRIDELQDRIEDLEDSLFTETSRADENERIAVNLFYALRGQNQQAANQFWHDEETMQALIPARIFPQKPGTCIEETSLIDTKSYCEMWQRWTNCREVNHCVMRDALKEGKE